MRKWLCAMKRRPGVLLLVGAIVGASCALSWAQKEMPERLVIDDFEGNVAARWAGGIVPHTTLVKEGVQGGH